ncbi:phosphoribosyltransferase family protein [Subtercola frigoramans]|uniref:Adenine phosphoribosyltransferase n=1 Tax=Subtercola frigoramans TaxID=120298 RepID=A0ABS2L4L8_9MICO|nr:phosphoribosyltransferase family protein [Subtercola frigoramans]MBM7471831.1 adenine phosphoribosyltransferase [Subtercola frigoramans]
MSDATSTDETKPMPSFYTAQIGSQQVELPIVPVSDSLLIALMMIIDHGVEFAAKAGAELAGHFAAMQPEIVVAPATLGIPLAIEVTRSLGLDDYLILQKTRKIHLRDALSEPVTAITSEGSQSLLLDRNRIPSVAGRRTLFVDDVISTGSSTAAALRLLAAAGADVVGVGALLTESDAWREPLSEYADRIFALGSIPVFPR